MDYVNETFQGVVVPLDGNTFRDCTFDRMVFQYSGGPVEKVNCNLNNFSFEFGGDLAQGLFTLYQLFGTEGMLTILRGFTDPGVNGEVTLPV
jgi:hypothetical protein